MLPASPHNLLQSTYVAARLPDIVRKCRYLSLQALDVDVHSSLRGIWLWGLSRRAATNLILARLNQLVKASLLLHTPMLPPAPPPISWGLLPQHTFRRVLRRRRRHRRKPSQRSKRPTSALAGNALLLPRRGWRTGRRDRQSRKLRHLGRLHLRGTDPLLHLNGRTASQLHIFGSQTASEPRAWQPNRLHDPVMRPPRRLRVAGGKQLQAAFCAAQGTHAMPIFVRQTPQR